MYVLTHAPTPIFLQNGNGNSNHDETNGRQASARDDRVPFV